ncbi:MAG: hypothetical protein JSV33_03340 [bacterium]|nr:MAG: hypothetical protein JSV33_03340 [bacterium]
MPMAIGSGVASGLFLFRWNAFLSRFEGIDFAILPWFLIACLAIIAAFTTWAHAILLIGRQERSIMRRLPKWIRRPWIAGSLGLLVPGFGLFIAGRSRRAVCALWSAGALLMSVIVLSNGTLLWSWHHKHGYDAISGHSIEFVFLALCAIGFLGGIGWIVQALDGARLSGPGFSKPWQSRSERFAVALLVMIAAFFVMFDTGYVAETLDRFAVSKRQDGFQIIPLYMTRGAMHIDPSRPEYVLHVIELYDEMGRPSKAETMRRELCARLMPCMSLMLQYGLSTQHGVSPLQWMGTDARDDMLMRRKSLLWSPVIEEIDTHMSVF